MLSGSAAAAATPYKAAEPTNPWHQPVGRHRHSPRRTAPLAPVLCPARRHKKVKLRVLKFYKVDDSGKVQRLRKVCPQCGPGIFMATHFNRVYCGKCHLTYVYDKDGQTA